MPIVSNQMKRHSKRLLKCGACGAFGHIRTNRKCPFYCSTNEQSFAAKPPAPDQMTIEEPTPTEYVSVEQWSYEEIIEKIVRAMDRRYKQYFSAIEANTKLERRIADGKRMHGERNMQWKIVQEEMRGTITENEERQQKIGSEIMELREELFRIKNERDAVETVETEVIDEPSPLVERDEMLDILEPFSSERAAMEV